MMMAQQQPTTPQPPVGIYIAPDVGVAARDVITALRKHVHEERALLELDGFVIDHNMTRRNFVHVLATKFGRLPLTLAVRDLRHSLPEPITEPVVVVKCDNGLYRLQEGFPRYPHEMVGPKPIAKSYIFEQLSPEQQVEFSKVMHTLDDSRKFKKALDDAFGKQLAKFFLNNARLAMAIQVNQDIAALRPEHQRVPAELVPIDVAVFQPPSRKIAKRKHHRRKSATTNNNSSPYVPQTEDDFFALDVEEVTNYAGAYA